VSTQISLEVSPLVALIAEQMVKLLRRLHGVAFSLNMGAHERQATTEAFLFVATPTRSFFAVPIDNHGKKEEKDRDEKEHMEESMYEEEVRAAGGRDYEVEGLKRRKAGEINDADNDATARAAPRAPRHRTRTAWRQRPPTGQRLQAGLASVPAAP
jgi:hypothetical protein